MGTLLSEIKNNYCSKIAANFAQFADFAAILQNCCNFWTIIFISSLCASAVIRDCGIRVFVYISFCISCPSSSVAAQLNQTLKQNVCPYFIMPFVRVLISEYRAMISLH